MSHSKAVATLKEKLAAGRHAEVLSTIASLSRPTSSLEEVRDLGALLRKVPSEARAKWRRRPVKIALLSASTVSHMSRVLELYLAARRMDAEIHVSGYNFEAEILSRDDALARFRPDVCIILPDARSIGTWPSLGCSAEEHAALVEAEASRWSKLQGQLHEWLGCTVVQDGFFCLERPMGQFERRSFGSRSRFLHELNGALAREPAPFVRFHDLEFALGRSALAKWHDPRLWHHAKYLFAPDAVPSYCHSIAGLLAAAFGLAKKCLVLDLDNTLWGGVIGDDGLQGIVIGEGSGDGEAFKAFQAYVKNLKRHGILLAVCSKNEDAVAREPFAKLSELPLSVVDFDLFVANWSPKGQNLAEIAARLNIGIDSLVFFDDNPAEREQVRFSQPDVFVVEVPEEPAQYVEALDEMSLFEVDNLTKEDTQRSQLYTDERARESFAAQFSDYAAYLKTLDMEAVAKPFDKVDLVRITQLINKTNQFNLTTRRYTEAETSDIAESSRYVTRSLRLADRFGDHGIIAAFIGRLEGDTLAIELFLMSCRVFKRNAEHFLFGHVLREAEARGVSRVTGRYVPTAKNPIVADFYAELGFRCTAREQGGATVWELVAPFVQPHHHIRERL